MTEQETQFAKVRVVVEVPVEKDATELERRGAAEAHVRRYLEGEAPKNFRYIDGVPELLRTESEEETAERRMAEAEGEAIARAERRYERFLEERGSRYR